MFSSYQNWFRLKKLNVVLVIFFIVFGLSLVFYLCWRKYTAYVIIIVIVVWLSIVGLLLHFFCVCYRFILCRVNLLLLLLLFLYFLLPIVLKYSFYSSKGKICVHYIFSYLNCEIIWVCFIVVDFRSKKKCY